MVIVIMILSIIGLMGTVIMTLQIDALKHENASLKKRNRILYDQIEDCLNRIHEFDR